MLKAQFSSLRLQPRQKKVERFVRDLFRLMSEVIGEIFSPETMSKITGISVTPEILALLRDDDSYQIDVETDSTVIADDAADKQAVAEYLQAVGGFMQMAMAGGIARPVAMQIMLWASRRFKVSREVEDLIQGLPEDQGVNAKDQANIMKEQQKAQVAQQRLQLDAAKLTSQERIKLAELDLKERELDQERQEMLLKAQAAFRA